MMVTVFGMLFRRNFRSIRLSALHKRHQLMSANESRNWQLPFHCWDKVCRLLKVAPNFCALKMATKTVTIQVTSLIVLIGPRIQIIGARACRLLGKISTSGPSGCRVCKIRLYNQVLRKFKPLRNISKVFCAFVNQARCSV
ncbi:hypothetical protein D3C72_1868980 [compost metagenome]